MTNRNAVKKHLPGLAGAAVLVLALAEALLAVLAPSQAPSDADWSAAAATIRADFRQGDLIVAAPDWADPVMRMHLGDLVTVDMATRMDGLPYGRVWQLSQRGARAKEATGQQKFSHDYGNLNLTRWERPAAEVKFNFVNEWRHARVTREGASGSVACALLPDRHQCPDLAFNWVKPSIMEFDFTLRQALYVQPVGGSSVVVEYADVPMGQSLTVAAGLHHVWLRKGGEGSVSLVVQVAGQRLGQIVVNNRSPWRPEEFSTVGFVGQRQVVRFIITSEQPFSRHFGFAAEVRK